MRATLAAIGCLVLAASEATAAPRPVTIFLERGGFVAEYGGEETRIPAFGGGDRAWNGIVACVKGHFAPFQIDIVDGKPRRGDFITAVIGGKASMLGLSDRTTNGVGPYSPDRVLRNAVVHVFSKVGSGEKDVKNLCAVTVHETLHAMGLDHTFKCGDVMSYFLDRCGPRKILDVDAPCGEDGPRRCGDGAKTQNSYRKLAAAVGLRKGQPEPEPQPQRDPGRDPWGDDGYDDHDDGYDDGGYDDGGYEYDDGYGGGGGGGTDSRGTARRGYDYDEDEGYDDEDSSRGDDTTHVRGADGHVYSVQQVQKNGRRYIVIRRVR